MALCMWGEPNELSIQYHVYIFMQYVDSSKKPYIIKTLRSSQHFVYVLIGASLSKPPPYKVNLSSYLLA